MNAKKIVASALAATMIFGSLIMPSDVSNVTLSASAAEFMLGDVNQDEYIDYLDAMTALRYDAELITLTDEQLNLGDVNGDGSVDSLDAILILRYDAGLIDRFRDTEEVESTEAEETSEEESAEAEDKSEEATSEEETTKAEETSYDLTTEAEATSEGVTTEAATTEAATVEATTTEIATTEAVTTEAATTDVTTTEAEETPEETTTAADEDVTYHVGDSAMYGELKITYLSCGVYYEDSKYRQPDDGYKYIYFQLAFENTSDSDDYFVSYLRSEAYADNYAVDMYLYGDDKFSATLTAGRSVTGYVYFEVPEDAEVIELEYTPKSTTTDVFVFAYDEDAEGISDTDSGSIDSGTTDSSTDEETLYYVGDNATYENLNMVYLSSGVYTETNKYRQPEDGYKYIYLQFLLENTSDKDDVFVSYLKCDGYADDVAVDMYLWGDDTFSATLTAGRYVVGYVYFEVPEDAEEIEVEYQPSYISDTRFVFVYEEGVDSGYVIEKDTTASADAVSVGESADADDLTFTYVSCEIDETETAPDGYVYVTCTFEITNNGSSDEFISYLDFECYADGGACDLAYIRDDRLSATISSGRVASGTITYEVPEDATTVEVEYVEGSTVSSYVVFSCEY